MTRSGKKEKKGKKKKGKKGRKKGKKRKEKNAEKVENATIKMHSVLSCDTSWMLSAAVHSNQLQQSLDDKGLSTARPTGSDVDFTHIILLDILLKVLSRS